MARKMSQLLRAAVLAAMITAAASTLRAPSLVAQNTATVQVSATVVSVAPAREAALEAQSQALRLASVVQTQHQGSQRVSTASRIAQVSTERLRAAGTGRPEEPEAFQVTVEYAAN